MKKYLFTRVSVTLLAAALLLSFAGCGILPAPTLPTVDTVLTALSADRPSNVTPSELAAVSAAHAAPAGRLLLSVNPEIEVEYDARGFVLSLEGSNDDGRALLVDLEDGLEGLPCAEALREIVKRIYDAGYFEQTVNGRPRNLVLKLEEGSAAPDDAFLAGLAEELRSTVEAYRSPSRVETVAPEDQTKGYIGKEKAQELLLSQLGIRDARFVEHEYELDDGVYEFEVIAGGLRYEYELDARTGKVLERDVDNDDWDDRYNDDWDDRYDDDWDDRYDDDWDDRYDDDWDDRYDDDWDDRYDDDWDDRWDD